MRCSILVVCIAVPMSVGCEPQQDSWKHYQNGGHFDGGFSSVSPDGNHVVYASPRTGQGDIHMFDRAKKKSIRLTKSDRFESSPIYSPDGNYIAFRRENGEERGEIWLIDTKTKLPRRLTQSAVYDDYWPEFSSDSATVYFLRSGRSGLSYSEGGGTYSINIDGSKLKRLYSEPVGLSPNGKKYARTKRNNENGRLEILETDVTNDKSEVVGNGWNPTYSPDGEKLVAISDDLEHGIVLIDLKSKTSRRLKAPRGYKYPPTWSGDGKSLVVTIDDLDNQGVGRVYLINIETEECELIVDTR